LYYTTGQYQTAIDHCTLVTRSQDHSQCSSHVVQGELLPKIDDDIDTVLGLAVFYQYVLSATLNQQQKRYVSVFSTELFALYLHIRCVSVIRWSHVTRTTDEVRRHTKYISQKDQLFTADVLLLRSIKMFYKLKLQYKPFPEQCQKSASELDTSELVELLQQSAVEHLITYRQLEAQQFGSVSTIFTTDFEALYAYKCGDYQRCLLLSMQDIGALLASVDSPTISTYPQFIQLLDDDIVSLTALTLIVNPKVRDKNVGACIIQLTLMLYLMTQCQLKLHHSITSLTQTVNYIERAQQTVPTRRLLDHLTMKLTARRIINYLVKFTHSNW